MKQIIKTYTFDATAKTVTLNDFTTVLLERLQLIVNTSNNTIMYNFADNSVAFATVSGNVITLSTVGNATNGNKLQIVYDTATGDPSYDNIAKDGTDITGATMPAGGSGIRGWLSGIFNKLPVLGQTTAANSSPVVMASNQPAILNKGDFLEIAGLSAAANSALLVPSTDVSAYKWLSLHITGTWNATVTFQFSNDNTNWVNAKLTASNQTTNITVDNYAQSGAANLLFDGPIKARYFRAILTAYTSGTVTGVAELYSYSAALTTFGVTAAVSSLPSLPAGTNLIGVVRENNPATPSVTAVASSATSVTILAANTSRRQAMLFNASTSVLYLRFGATAATTAAGGYTTQVPANAYYELPYPVTTAALTGIWASANGSVSITEVV